MSNDAMTFPNEPEAYRAAREALVAEEKKLRAQAEKVASLRRDLPRGGEVDASLRFGAADGTSPSMLELFGDKQTLVVYGFMYGPKMERPCPLCTCYLDSLDGAVPHLEDTVATAVVGKSPIDRLMAFKEERGWRNHRMFSSSDNSFQRDYLAESPSGSQTPMINVFVRDGEKVFHTWGTELLYASTAEGEDARHLDIGWPTYAVLDMTPEGRGSFYPKLNY